MARHFYDRLKFRHMETGYPWTVQGASANDYALANIGQVKNLFNWDLKADTDSNSMFDSWELQVVCQAQRHHPGHCPGSSKR